MCIAPSQGPINSLDAGRSDWAHAMARSSGLCCSLLRAHTILAVVIIVAAHSRNHIGGEAARLMSSSSGGLSMNKTMAAASGNGGMKMWVSHIYDAHSPARPSNCDEVCVSELRIKHLTESWEQRQALRNKSRSSAQNPQGVRPDDDYWPSGQVSTGYFHSGAQAEYYVELSAGDPSNIQPILLIVDTGSHLTWMQCKPCNPCYSQSFPVFDPRRSSTYTPQVPGSTYCDILQNTGYGTGTDGGTCNYGLSYADGSSSQGQLAFETMWFWDLNNNDEPVAYQLPFGCGFSNVNPVPTVTSGVLGLADELGLSWPEYWGGVYGYNPSFTFCFASIFSQPNSGWIIFADGATTPTQGIPLYSTIPILDQGGDGMTYMDVVDFIVNGQRVGIPDDVFDINPNDGSGGVLLDTGSMISEMVEDAYEPFKTAWQNAMEPILGEPDNSDTPGPPGFEMCWDYQNDVQLPDMGFMFRDQQVFYLSARAKTLIYYSQSKRRRMCFPFRYKDQDNNPAMYWGSLNLHNHRIIFDKQNDVISWQYNCC
ncbi:hypothetical protein L7F22_007615 [Adiantum nelumboides]|nr:hypothetical protein [Adiantum nelumboides]